LGFPDDSVFADGIVGLESTIKEGNFIGASEKIDFLIKEGKKYLEEEDWFKAAQGFSQIINTSLPLSDKISIGKVVGPLPEVQGKIVKSLCQSINFFSKSCYFLADNPPDGIDEEELVKLSHLFLDVEHKLGEDSGDEVVCIKAKGNQIMLKTRSALVKFYEKGERTQARGDFKGIIDEMKFNIHWGKIIRKGAQGNDLVSLNYVANFYNSLADACLKLGQMSEPEQAAAYILEAREALKKALDLHLPFLEGKSLDQPLNQVKMAVYSNYAYTYVFQLYNYPDFSHTNLLDYLNGDMFIYFRDFINTLDNSQREENKEYFKIEANLRCALIAGLFLKARGPKSQTVSHENNYSKAESKVLNLLLGYLGNMELSMEFDQLGPVPPDVNILKKLVATFLNKAISEIKQPPLESNGKLKRPEKVDQIEVNRVREIFYNLGWTEPPAKLREII